MKVKVKKNLSRKYFLRQIVKLKRKKISSRRRKHLEEIYSSFLFSPDNKRQEGQRT